jgi:hypothetical protein
MQSDVLQLLVSGWTTPLQALERANTMSFSQRVGELIRAGYPVQKRWERLASGKQVRAYRIEP